MSQRFNPLHADPATRPGAGHAPHKPPMPGILARPRQAALGAAMVLAATLAACSALPDKPSARPVVYDFGPGERTESAQAPASAAKPARLLPLTLANIDAPAALDGTAVLYRLAYADVQQLRPYSQARWSMPPAQLLRQRLREQLGRERVVLGGGQAPGEATLDVELEEFSQVFEAPARSVGLVRLRATLVGRGGGGVRQTAQQSFTAQRPAPTADAAGGVRALTEATDAAVLDILRWLQQQPALTH